MIPQSLRGLFNTLEDTDVVSMGTLRKLLDADERAGTTHWIELPEAAEILDMKPASLRSRARQWEQMARPPVRVSRKGASKSAHFLFDDTDIRAYRKGVSKPVIVPEDRPAEPDEDSVGATVAFWSEKATRNLSPLE